ncbi:putative protease [Erwinia phage pEa_SNUABM_8]|nr:putative protease [Erwinia phage pEa_SNUABM_8]QVW54767.1 hypothetical protein pEaSNUABM4_00002 [Erwinia phage pEa_SNUABM_4]
MTTIAYDGETLSSDSQVTQAQYRLDVNTPKIFEPGETESWVVEGVNAVAFGVAGPLEAQQVVRSVLAGFGSTCGVTTATAWPKGISMSFIIIDENGGVYTGGQEPDAERGWLAKVKPPMAVGSGCEFALGAMFAGAPSAVAVMSAIRYDVNTGGGVQTIQPRRSPITD